MSLKEFIKDLENYDGVIVELKDKDGYFLCITNTKSVGITPYLNKPILKWYVYNDDYYGESFDSCDSAIVMVSLTIYLDIDAVNVDLKDVVVNGEG